MVVEVLPIQSVSPLAIKLLEDNGYSYTQLKPGIAGFKKQQHEISEIDLLAMGLAVGYGTWNQRRVVTRRQEVDFLTFLKEKIESQL